MQLRAHHLPARRIAMKRTKSQGVFLINDFVTYKEYINLIAVTKKHIIRILNCTHY
jgi:hypothetical protein